MDLVKKIQENIFHKELFDRGAKIVVGVSGGPDSVCLIDVLCKLRKKYDLKLIVAHVNYGLRGKDSEKDEQLVKNLAGKYNLPLEITRNRKYKIQDANLEEKLRDLRYEFFGKIRKQYGADSIAVGHNMNDQAETVLMRILRGAGLRGLAAIKFKNGSLIRPLLNVPRENIVTYLRKNKLPWRTDKSNLGTDFVRNKVRNKLLPLLEKNFNPSLQRALCKLSQSVADDYDFIRRCAKEFLYKKYRIPASKLQKLHPALQSEILRLAVEKEAGLREIESGHIEEILKIARSKKRKRQRMVFKGLKVEKINDILTIEKITGKAKQ